MKLRHAALLGRYLRVMVWVFALSFFGQTFAPHETAAASVWGFAPGWQREIGFFDLAMALLAFRAIQSGDLRFQRGVALAFVVLTTLVGSNHVMAILSGQTAPLHKIFAAVNYSAVGFGLAALFCTSREIF